MIREEKLLEGLSIPNKIFFDPKTYTKEYGYFKIGPLDRGMANTIGVVLRRILLSVIPGYAITWVRIEVKGKEGEKKVLYHEFQGFPGAIEDVTDFIGNLRGVRLKLASEVPQKTISLNVKGPMELKAGYISQIHPDVIVANPDHHLLSITEDIEISLDLTIEWGRGYISSEEAIKVRDKQKTEALELLPVDAIFSPVVKVNYDVEPMYTGATKGYETLIMEIWTDGTVEPKEVLKESVLILKTYLEAFSRITETILVEEGKEEKIQEEELIKKLNRPIDEILGSASRAVNCLRQAGIKRVVDLVTKTRSELLGIKNFGEKSLEEVEKALEKEGLYLGMPIKESIIKLLKELRESV